MLTRWLLWWQQLGRLQQFGLLAGIVVTVVRLSLIGKGTMAFVDEQRYVTAMLGLRALSEGHVREFLQAINSMGARPGDGLWRIIPGLGQAALLVLFQLNPNSPPSLQVPQVLNVLIMSLNAVLLYQIYRRFLGESFALLSVALYSSLVNTNLYLRHILPYDHALFFFLLALWLLLTPSVPKKRARSLLIGLLSGFSFAVYPGYFMGPMVLLALGLARAVVPATHPEPALWRACTKQSAFQMVGVATVLLALEGLARLSGTSYYASSRYIATTVTQGSFQEGFSFIGQYFWQVEGGVGVGLLGLFGVGLVLSLCEICQSRGQRGDYFASRISLAGLLSIGALVWLGYAGAIFFLHKFVFYGRSLHFFVPFIVLGAGVALQDLASHWPVGKRLVLMSGWAIAMWHVGAFALAYGRVSYPADIAYNYGIHDARQITGISTTGCDKNVVYYRLFGPRIRGQRTASSPQYYLINFAYLYPLSCYHPLLVIENEVVATGPYFMKYGPYQFEGHNAAERALMQRKAFRFQILKTAPK